MSCVRRQFCNNAVMITQKMKYALKALMELATERAGEARPLRIEEIATRSDTPKRFLEHILLEIRNAGFIASARGRHGGYVLIKDPREVPLSEIMRLIDGPIAPLPCLSRRAYQKCDDCPDEETCLVSAQRGLGLGDPRQRALWGL